MTRIVAAFALPWAVFVAAFLYYTTLTLVVIGAEGLPLTFLAAYCIPVALYAAVLASRAIRALAGVRVDLGPLPYPSLR